MSQTGRLVAIADVFIESHPSLFEQMHWFYGELIDLRTAATIHDRGEPPTEIRFRSDRHDLCIALTDFPKIESIDVRVICEVPSLEDVTDQLTERKYDHDRLHGLAHTDRRLHLLDPAGNRVEIRRLWPQRTV